MVGGFFLWLIELLLKPCHCALQCLLGRNKNKAIPDKVGSTAMLPCTNGRQAHQAQAD